MTTAAPVPTANPGPENLVRGTLFALVAVPVGVVLWVVIWSFGFVSAIVAFAIAASAAWLYRRGSGGRVSTRGALLISGVVLFTLLLSFYIGLVTDYVRAVAEQTGLTWSEAFTHPLFWTAFNEDFGALLNDNLLNLGLALLFGVFGAFSVLRRAFVGAKSLPAGTAPATQDPFFPAPPAPPVAPQVNPGSSGILNSGTEEQPEKI
ncbi:MAG: hypothetical protein JWO18_857 [Microbacteriaceae bacterium]|jgi:hypothetical protein|nr:hypothetical protein [Microbacteriaceae bacterium]